MSAPVSPQTPPRPGATAGYPAAGQLAAGQGDDPRATAEGDDLATRHVLPLVALHQRHTEGWALLGDFGVTTLLGLATFWSLSGNRAEHAAHAAPATLPPAAQASATPAPALSPFAPPPQLLTPLPPAATNAAANAAAANPAPAPQTIMAANPLANPTVVFDAGALPVAEGGPAAPPGAEGKNTATAGAANGGDDFAARLGTAGGGAASATASFNPATTIAQGTLIPAVLETAIDTDVPGYARAVVSADVRGFDGTRVLVPRSSRLVGQYKSGLQAGQRRVYVIWTRLIRPDGVSVNIGSPATGYAGESGLGGQVNTHFFERFGSAMLLTVMGGLSAIGSNGTSVVIAGGGQSAAAAAVGQTGQIGPTIRVHPGEPVRVFTARDLDFAKASAP